jgi:hypothetical protein
LKRERKGKREGEEDGGVSKKREEKNEKERKERKEKKTSSHPG